MVLHSFSHWGMTELPDNERMANLFIDSEGVVGRLDYDEETRIATTVRQGRLVAAYPLRRGALFYRDGMPD